MNIGMLWYDNDPKANLATKVQRAATYYREKHGKAANLCFAHPSMLPDGTTTVGEVEVRPSKLTIINHFWIGVDDDPNADRAE